MNNIVCPLCGTQKNHKTFSEKQYDVFICKNCGLFFIHPYGSEVHEKVSNYAYDNLEMLDPARHYVSSKSGYKNKYYSFIKNECTSAKSILDVGCGTGALLELLHFDFPDMKRVGIELNAGRAEFARKSVNCEIFQVPIEKFASDGKFDIITMINVLSHIPSFDDLFTSICKLISPDGKLIIKVSEMAVDVKKDAFFDWGIPDHLHFLGLETMQFICIKYGFTIIHHERIPLSSDLFSYSRWMNPGRSTLRNIVKRLVALTPFALWLLRKVYDKRHGEKVFSSYIVISPAEK